MSFFRMVVGRFEIVATSGLTSSSPCRTRIPTALRDGLRSRFGRFLFR
jgi:hypothetical protein